MEISKERHAKKTKQYENDSLRELYEKTDEYVNSQGYKPVECGNLGDCFYRSLAHGLGLEINDETSLCLRNQVVEYLRSNPQKFMLFFEFTEEHKDLEYAEYLTRLSQPRAWVEGELEIRAASHVFNIEIVVFGKNEQYTNTFENPDAVHTVRLVNYLDHHFRSTTPIIITTEDEQP